MLGGGLATSGHDLIQLVLIVLAATGALYFALVRFAQASRPAREDRTAHDGPN
jgi:hypothetical protein